MSLIVTVEDGTGVINANSYATLAYVRAYNLQRGIELDDDNDVVVAQMIQAMDYVEAYEPRFMGDRALPLTQVLSWPRMNVYIYNGYTAFSAAAIPTILANAEAYLTSVVNSGVDLYAVQDTRAITKEVIGPLETDYSVTTGATLKPIIPNADAILAPLLRSGAGTLRSIRM